MELYRPDTDPGETHELGQEHSGEVRTLMEALVEQGEIAREGAVERQSVEMDAEAAQRLQNLGYME